MPGIKTEAAGHITQIGRGHSRPILDPISGVIETVRSGRAIHPIEQEVPIATHGFGIDGLCKEP
jgi:hypothetical protein